MCGFSSEKINNSNIIKSELMFYAGINRTGAAKLTELTVQVRNFARDAMEINVCTSVNSKFKIQNSKYFIIWQ
jgi:hypothetical protein